jgi:phosphatidylglycerol:prolipoprotein diacylglycerol transferase
VIGGIVASSVLIMLLRKNYYSIRLYSRILLYSSGGCLVGAKLFGVLTGLYSALANGTPVTWGILFNTGIVFYGGLMGFVATFLLFCKKWTKRIDYGVLDLVVVCIPLFHVFARGGCFFAGCCFGIETASPFSIMYTNNVQGVLTTVPRVPVQLIESAFELVIFSVLLTLLNKEKQRGHFLSVYLLIYAPIRIVLELFRGDEARGIWNGISFSQVVSVVIIITCLVRLVASIRKTKKRYKSTLTTK